MTARFPTFAAHDPTRMGAAWRGDEAEATDEVTSPCPVITGVDALKIAHTTHASHDAAIDVCRCGRTRWSRSPILCGPRPRMPVHYFGPGPTTLCTVYGPGPGAPVGVLK